MSVLALLTADQYSRQREAILAVSSTTAMALAAAPSTSIVPGNNGTIDGWYELRNRFVRATENRGYSSLSKDRKVLERNGVELPNCRPTQLP